MSIKIMSQVWQSAPVDGRRLLVLLSLADNCNDDGMCYPSVAYIARKTRQSERNVQYSLRYLEKHGLVKCASDENGFRRYFLNMKLMCEGAKLAPLNTSPCTEGVQPLVENVPALAPKPSLTVKEP